MKLKPIDKIQYIPLRVKDNKVYYFAEDGVVHTRYISRLPERIQNYYKDMYSKELLYVRKEYNEDEYINARLKKFSLDEIEVAEFKLEETVSLPLRKAMAMLKEGDTYKDLEQYLLESVNHYNNMYKVMAEKKGIYHDKPQGLDRFIVKILKPIIQREPENNNLNTFDIIKVQIDIISQWDTDRMQYIKDNKQEIVHRAVEKISHDNKFKKYGVSVNILALTKIMRINSNMIELIFELKKDIRE